MQLNNSQYRSCNVAYAMAVVLSNGLTPSLRPPHPTPHALHPSPQRCGNVVSNQQVLWANFLAQSALCFVLLCCFERDRLQRLLHLGMPELGAVAALAGGINWGANLVQQVCIQRLGAPATAAFLPGARQCLGGS